MALGGEQPDHGRPVNICNLLPVSPCHHDDFLKGKSEKDPLVTFSAWSDFIDMARGHHVGMTWAWNSIGHWGRNIKRCRWLVGWVEEAGQVLLQGTTQHRIFLPTKENCYMKLLEAFKYFKRYMLRGILRSSFAPWTASESPLWVAACEGENCLGRSYGTFCWGCQARSSSWRNCACFLMFFNIYFLGLKALNIRDRKWSILIYFR